MTLRRAAGSLLEAAGAPPEALDPLMRRTIENGFELTGPIARGDWETVDAHRAAIRAERPELEPMYVALAETTKALAVKIVRRIGDLALDARRRPRADDGRAPRRARGADRAPRAPSATTVVVSLFVNPAQFDDGADLAAYPRDEERDLRIAEAAGADVLFAPAQEEMYPPGFQTWVDVEELSRGLEGAHRPGHFRGVATVCLKLFNIVRPRYAYFGQKDAQQVAVVRRLVRDLDLDVEIRVGADRSRRRRAGALVPQRTAVGRRARGRARPPPRARDPRPRAPRAPRSTGSTSTTSRSPTSTHPFSPPRSASAPPA